MAPTDDLPPESDEPEDETWDDLEQAYRQALAALDTLEAAGPVGDDADAGDVNLRVFDGEDSNVAQSAAPAPAESVAAGSVRLTPRQILEAVLFVGGEPLTSRRLCGLFRDEFTAEGIDQLIQELNARYADEERPYEIRLAEGGYRMELRAEFLRIRNRAFGLQPREVKLSQETLEVLALVAYRQPITKKEIEQAGRGNAGGILNQLLRRELIALDRGGKTEKRIAYRTTARFLQLFGLRTLDDLPQADELSFK